MSKSAPAKQVIHIAGWTACPWFGRASKLGASLQLLYPHKYEAEVHELPTRDEYRANLAKFRAVNANSEAAQAHAACPMVWLAEGDRVTFIGGCDATVAWARSLLSPAAASEKAAAMRDDGASKEHGFEYDVVVIGGGSGGLACSKEMARLGAKVAVLDYVKPSPAGTTWGLGGTCVNVGCIPKKLMHTASMIGESLKDDAGAYGWKVQSETHDWAAMVENVQDHVKSLNFKYRVALREAGVTYLNRLGAFKDAHTLTLTDKQGQTSEITAARFVVAVGGRPSRLPFEGAEHCVDSDDLFSLKKNPGRVLCVGAGYIALECGGFLAGLGYPTTCMVRSILLRGFDRECVDKIQGHMSRHGVRFQVGVTPVKVEKVGDVLKVHDSNGDVNEYDTVILAVGRVADTKGLNLEAVPGALESLHEKSGKFACVDEQVPTAPHLYAIGDVVHGRPELTPVAIEAGLRLARRLYSPGSNEAMDYENVATTVFTPLEYGAIGLSEDDAIAELGADGVEVFLSEFSPLEHSLSETRAERGDQAFAKLVCDKSRNLKVVGFHYLGPNAGEVTQGFATAMRKGATYADFQGTVGIHPTVAEEFTTLSVTKASGASAQKGGC